MYSLACLYRSHQVLCGLKTFNEYEHLYLCKKHFQEPAISSQLPFRCKLGVVIFIN